ncbi:type II toxin-antitoxin system RelE/ParE family toxin [Chitinophagaceae bacterium LWZ2-11]
MVVLFIDQDLEKIYKKGEEKGKPIYGEGVIKAFIRKIDILIAVNNSRELAQLKSLNFEKLKKEYVGFCSVRVNNQYRIVFKIIKEKDRKEVIEIAEIHEQTDYH